MNQNEENFITPNNATSINIDYSDYSNNKLPLWAKKGLKINCSNDESSMNLVANRMSSTIASSAPAANRTRISLYNNRSTDSDERNSVEDGQTNEQFESPIERLKKKAQLLSTSHSNAENTSLKLNGGDHNDVDDLSSLNKKKNPLYVSTENLRYNDNFFAKTPLPKSTHSSIHLSNTLNKPSPGQKPSVLVNSSTPKSSHHNNHISNNSNQLNSNISLNSSSLNNSLNSSVPIKSMNSSTTNTINRPVAITKRREELAKALNEARAKLQNLTDINRKSTGGLSTSMSVANINRLSSLSTQHQKEKNSLLVTAPIQRINFSASINQPPQSYENDAVRRSISLSDLSHSQMLANRSLTLKQQQQIRNKISPSQNNVYYPLRNFKKGEQQSVQQTQFDPPQGLWDSPTKHLQQPQQQFEPQPTANYHHERLLNSNLNTSQNSINQLHNHHQQPNGSTPTHKPIRVRMSRSSSMASISKNDSLVRTLDNNKPQGLWNSSSLSINTLRSNSSVQNSFNKFNHHNKHHRKASSDDESSSDENDLYHRISQRPSTPPKPTLRQLRRSSTTSNNLFPPTNNNANNNSANLTLQQNNASSSAIKSTHKTSSPNRKSWSNNFELRPAKSEYNLNSMGQETVNSPSSGFWSNQSNSGNNGHQSNGTMTNGNLKMTGSKQNTIGYENFDLTNINPATVPLTSELFQHIVDELNHLGTFAKKVHYRAQAEENDKLCNLLKEGVSKAYVNLQTIVPFSSNNVLSITKSLAKESTYNHHHNLTNLTNNNLNGHHGDSSNTDHDTEEDNLTSPSNNNAAVGHVSLTSDSASSSLPQESLAMNLLQHYSERLLSMVEGQIRNKDK